METHIPGTGDRDPHGARNLVLRSGPQARGARDHACQDDALGCTGSQRAVSNRGVEARHVSVVKRVLVGRPISSADQEHQRLSKSIALAVFSSDAISSTAYATEEVLFVVALGASSLVLGLDALIPIAIAVAVLLAVVVTSYRQTIFAYPGGGGSYVVSRENLGENPSLVAGASILVDYILTVAVSISAGVAAIVSIPALQDLQTHRVELGLALILLISVGNLRGLKESGRVFAVPTYFYIVMVVAAHRVRACTRASPAQIGTDPLQLGAGGQRV